jgi:hypothetical protein
MRDALWYSGLIQGLFGGVATLVVLAIRAAIDGRTGVTFADLWTALAVGILVGVVPFVITRLVAWRFGRSHVSDYQEASGSGSFIHGSWEDRPGGRFQSGVGGVDRFNKFTDRARKVLTLAQDEAQRFNHNYIGTEHLLLGLVREGEGVAARVLENMNVELAKVRMAVEFMIGRGARPVVGEVGLTPPAKRVIELAIDEARHLGHNYIGTEHLLLGLVREGDGIAAGVLESLGIDFDRVRHEVIRAISSRDDSG